MVAESMETLATLNETVDDSTQQIFEMNSESIKMCLLFHLEDSEEASANMHLLRFYYMPLFTGLPNCKTEASCITDKLPPLIRKPLFFLTMKRLVSIHQQIDEARLLKESMECMPQRNLKAIARAQELSRRRDDEDKGFVTVDYESDRLPMIESPFGFTIQNTRTLLRASYMHIYHNKDEAERGPAAKQIVSKVMKTETQLRERLLDPSPLDLNSEFLSNDLKTYEFNSCAIIHGSELLRRNVISASDCRFKSELWNYIKVCDEWFEKSILMPVLVRTTYADLASTSASFLNEGELSIKVLMSKSRRVGRKGDDDSSDDSDAEDGTDDEKEEDNYRPLDPKSDLTIGRTIKCLEAVLKRIEIGDFKGLGPIDDIEQIYYRIKIEDGDRIVVKIFKKNQLTGVREIYILTIIGRMLIRVVEDMARAICKRVPIEKLTDPKSRDSFMAEHYSQVKSQYPEFGQVQTVKISGDMTSWANLWLMKAISIPLIRLTPESMHPIIASVMNMVTDKRIELPRQFVRSAILNPSTVLYDKVSQRIKNEMLNGSSDNEYIKKHGTRLSCRGNMMQGILHYTSSLAHSSAMYLFRSVVHSYLKKHNLNAVISIEVSSDDKGILISIISPQGQKIRDIGSHVKNISLIQECIDHAYGIRTSEVKSTITLTALYEFNSIFHSGNSVVSPLAKFTSRACDDSMQSSLHNRVTSLYSNLRQVRENGGTGILCSIISMCQQSMLLNNLGLRSMDWFDDDVLSMLGKYKLSYLGFRITQNPIVAGICMADYENRKWANKDNLWKAIYRRLSINEYKDSEFIDKLSTKFGMWSRKKHNDFLKRLNIERSDELSKHDLKLLLKKNLNIEEQKEKIRLIAQSGDIARSLIMVERSDILRAAPYLLWSAIFKVGESEDRVTFSELQLKLSSLEPIDDNLMSTTNYIVWSELEKKVRIYIPRMYRLRLKSQLYEPIQTYSHTRDEATDILRHVWFGHPLETLTVDIDDVNHFMEFNIWVHKSFDETLK
jgi:hypothetical protein